MGFGAMRLLMTISCVLLSGCGAAAVNVNLEETVFAPSLNVDLGASTKLGNGEYVRDLEIGTGKDLTAQELISTRYTGWLSDGDPFDGNASDGGVFTFNYGAKQVIAGWDQGLDGMKRGGTRQLIIPPTLAYGAGGAPPAIPPNAVVVFNVQLLMETTGSPPGCGCGAQGGVSVLALVLLVFAVRKGSLRS